MRVLKRLISRDKNCLSRSEDVLAVLSRCYRSVLAVEWSLDRDYYASIAEFPVLHRITLGTGQEYGLLNASKGVKYGRGVESRPNCLFWSQSVLNLPNLA